VPRRNFWFIAAAALLSLACYRAGNHNAYGRYFADVMNKIDRLYVEPVDNEKLFDSAIAGMLQDLDEHSRFFPPEDVQGFMALIEQHYGGVGIEVTADPATRRLTVISTIVGSPAYAADIQAGDQILKVDGADTLGMDLEDVTRRIRGPLGEPVLLTLARAGQGKPLDVSVTRADVKVDTVRGDTRNPDDSWNFHLAGHPDIAYLRITSFGDQTADELRQALDSLPPENLKGLILDLRFNPGGLLSEAIDVCSQFIAPGQTVVTTRDRDKNVLVESRSHKPVWSTEVPMVVLVNSESASASEIVSACLQDYKRAAICGQRSYGKGTVQQIFNVEGNKSILKLTTATYWRPSNKNIDRHKDAKETDEWGVMPDAELKVELTKDQTEKMLKNRAARDVARRAQSAAAETAKAAHHAPAEVAPYVDPQLQRALEYLQKPR